MSVVPETNALKIFLPIVNCIFKGEREGEIGNANLSS